MIYTSYDMVRDCQANLAPGWSHLVSHYVPVIRKILDHYVAERDRESLTQQVLMALHDPGDPWIPSLELGPERIFVAALRQQVLAIVERLEPAADPGVVVDLEQASAAFAPLTLVERQIVWLETMRYSAAQTGKMMRIDERTAAKVRTRAGELLRGQVDAWRQTVLTENGRRLSGLAAAAATPQCLPSKAFLDVLDGRSTWRGREELEGHVKGCWHCVDHFSRMVEVAELLRGVRPLTEAEAEPFYRALGIAAAKKSGWKSWFARG